MLIDEEIEEGEVSKVWICGPPRMNEGVSKFLREKYKQPDLYLLV
jgi:NAD(P)H-flavin reductase